MYIHTYLSTRSARIQNGASWFLIWHFGSQPAARRSKYIEHNGAAPISVKSAAPLDAAAGDQIGRSDAL